MSRLKQAISETLAKTLAEAGVDLPAQVKIEEPQQKAFGDLSTNVAFMLTKTYGKPPAILATELLENLSNTQGLKDKLTFTSVNGFINMTLSESYLWTLIGRLDLSKPDFPKSDDRVLLEYVSANPTGPLHVGHGRWAVIGDILAKLLRKVGHKVETEFYINDAGTQIDNLRASVAAVKSGQPIPENGYHGSYIHDLAASDADPVQANLNAQRKTLDHLNVRFDRWFSETSLHGDGNVMTAMKALQASGHTYEKDGALWFKSSDYGDEKDRVLVKAEGAYTYFAVDLAYHYEKIQRKYTQLINIWGADHHGYVKRVKAGVQALAGDGFDSQSQLIIMLGQLVSLLRGGKPVRLSKRSGEIITLQEVIDEIGADAFRYFMIEKSPDTHVEFDLEIATQKSNDNPVFYVQYAHARICSIFERVGQAPETQPALDEELEDKERALLWQLLQWHDVVFNAAMQRSPHKIATYVHQVAKAFHLFYQACPIKDAAPSLRQRRLYLCRRSQDILRDALALLGISAPTSM